MQKEIRISEIRSVKSTTEQYFQIETRQERIYYLWATKPKEATEWVSAINKLVREYKQLDKDGGHSRGYAKVQQKKLVKARLEDYKKAALKAKREKKADMLSKCNEMQSKCQKLLDDLVRGENVNDADIPPPVSELFGNEGSNKPQTAAKTVPQPTNVKKTQPIASPSSALPPQKKPAAPVKSVTATHPPATSTAHPAVKNVTPTPTPTSAPPSHFLRSPEESLVANDVIEFEQTRVKNFIEKLKSQNKDEEVDELEGYLIQLNTKLAELQLAVSSQTLTLELYLQQLKNRIEAEDKLIVQFGQEGHKVQEALAKKRKEIIEKEVINK